MSAPENGHSLLAGATIAGLVNFFPDWHKLVQAILIAILSAAVYRVVDNVTARFLSKK